MREEEREFIIFGFDSVVCGGGFEREGLEERSKRLTRARWTR
jgi:hypothetical protein